MPGRTLYYPLALYKSLVAALRDAIFGMDFLWRSYIGTGYAKCSSVVITYPLTEGIF